VAVPVIAPILVDCWRPDRRVHAA